MFKTVTRAQVLKAIRKESLVAGHFIKPLVVGGIIDKYCKVCAVGAVLRSIGTPSNKIASTAQRVCDYKYSAHPEFNWETELEKENYLGALSIYFETKAKKHGAGKKTKDKLIAFVKTHFPKIIKFKMSLAD